LKDIKIGKEGQKMPMMIKHIDKIAREKERGVLSVTFEGDKFETDAYEEYAERKELIAFLEKNHIGYEMCGDIASETGWRSYRGQLYIDLPFVKENTQYMLLEI
jgi:hypothetical protein